MSNPRIDDLTAIEQHLMLAVMRKRPNAYGVSIKEEIELRTERSYSLGTIYTVLQRLTDRGFLTSRSGEASAERGGRAKMFFEITGEGQRALSHSLRVLDRMRGPLVPQEAL